MTVDRKNLPEVQFHLLGRIGGYAVGTTKGNYGNQYKKLLMTCDL